MEDQGANGLTDWAPQLHLGPPTQGIAQPLRAHQAVSASELDTNSGDYQV